MCVAFDKLLIYQYIFAPDKREDLDALDKLSYEDIAVFCSELNLAITSQSQKNPCYKYVLFDGFEVSYDFPALSADASFIEFLDMTVCENAETLTGMPEIIENKYSSAYHEDQTIPEALKSARSSMRDRIKKRKDGMLRVAFA